MTSNRKWYLASLLYLKCWRWQEVAYVYKILQLIDDPSQCQLAILFGWLPFGLYLSRTSLRPFGLSYTRDARKSCFTLIGFPQSSISSITLFEPVRFRFRHLPHSVLIRLAESIFIGYCVNHCAYRIRHKSEILSNVFGPIQFLSGALRYGRSNWCAVLSNRSTYHVRTTINIIVPLPKRAVYEHTDLAAPK